MFFRCDISITREWRNQNLPKPICDFMEKWEKRAAEAMKTYKFQWPAKLVETQFIYDNESYSITPATFGIPDDLCEIFQSNSMDDDLRGIPGVENVQSCGFLD